MWTKEERLSEYGEGRIKRRERKNIRKKGRGKR